MTSTIIFINGTSSSGKTSILRALQKQLAEPYLDTGIDRFIFMMPKRYLDRPLWDEVLGKAVESGETGRVLFSDMHHAIADHVFVEKAWVDECVFDRYSPSNGNPRAAGARPEGPHPGAGSPPIQCHSQIHLL